MQYTLKVTDVLTLNGVTCPPDKLVITFEQPDCGDISCILSTNTIVVNIPDGCDQKCFYGTVTCNVDCDGCGTKRIEICPCSHPTDCAPCGHCDLTRHVCVSNCGPGKFCSEECGGCAECDSEHPCTGGRTCQGCKCECPPDKPYTNPFGQCSNCLTKDHCGPCEICTPEGCKPIVCSIGVCNPETSTCVGCNVNGDCNKPNECCGPDKTCVCCNGYQRNANGDCVIKPECTQDSDCGDCRECDLSIGKCKPKQCPPGTTCVGENICAPICDCDNPTCDSINACVRKDETTCYCSKCEGSCANGEPCGPGCYCHPITKQCTVNPCKGSCENGTDCGPGCGCNPVTKQCEPCASKICGVECTTLLGCECLDNKNCTKVPDCGGECSTKTDCPDNCTCHKGKCVSCKNFPCSECNNIPGCGCTDGVNCNSVPYQCADTLTIEKNDDNCSITGVLDVKSLCSCPILTAGVIPTAYSQTLNKILGSFRVELRKGNVGSIGLFNNAPLLNDLSVNALNDLPLGGLIEIKTIATYDEYNWTLQVYETKTDVIYTESKSIGNMTMVDFTGINVANVNFGTRNPNGIQFKGLGEYKPAILRHVDVVFSLKSKLDFASDCGYQPTQLFKLSSDVSLQNEVYILNWVLNQVSAIRNLSTTDFRKPLIVWSKTKNAAHTKDTIFRKVYAEKDLDGKYRDILYGPGASPIGFNAWPLTSPDGEIWAGYDYQLSSDCSCDTADIDDLHFCKPDLQYDLQNCNKKFVVTSNFTPCPINSDLRDYDPNGILSNKALVTDYDIPQNAQVTYEIFFNNVFKHSFVGSLSAGFELVHDEAITVVVIRQKIDNKEYCRKQISHPINIPVPPHVVSCSGNGSYYSVDITKVFSEMGQTFTVDGVSGPAITVNTVGNTITVGNLVKGTSTTLLITYGTGCTKNLIVTDNCCQYTSVSLTSDQIICSTGPATLTAVASGFSGTVTYSWNGGAFGTSSTFVANTPGTYTVVVRDGICQDKSASIIVTQAGGGLNFRLEPTTICSNGSAKINLAGDPGATYTINGPGGSVITGVIPESGTIPEVTVTEGGTYSLNNYISGPCTFNPGLTFNLNKLTNPTATLTYPNSIVCAGTPILITLSGTPNAVVNLVTTGILGSNSVILNSSGVGSTTVSFPNIGTSTVTITSVTLGTGLTACSNQANTVYTLTPLIVASPTIISGVAICNTLDPYSDYNIEVVATQGSVVTSPLGTLSLEMPHSPGYSTYKLENVSPIPGSTLVVTATSPLSGACTRTVNITIPTCNCPVISVTAAGATACPGDSGTLTSSAVSGPGTYTYQWYSTTTGAVSGATSSTYTTSTFGSYYLVVTQVGTSCTATSNTVALSNVVDPNPAIVLSGAPVFYPNIDYTYNVTLTPGVVVTGFASGNLTIVSSTGSQVVINASTSGAKSFTMTYTFGGCTFTKVVNIVVSNCYPITVNITGITANSCGNLTATASGGSSPYTFLWTGTGNKGTVISQTGNIFDATQLLSDEDITISVVATDANDCTGGGVMSYSRCSCICISSLCESASNVATAVQTGDNVTLVRNLGRFESGSDFEWLVSANGPGQSVRAVMKLDGAIIFDTGFISRASTACASTLCAVPVEFLGDNPATSVTLSGGTSPTGETAALVSGVCDYLNNNYVLEYVSGFLYGVGANVITLPGDGVVTIEITRGTCLVAGTIWSPATNFEVKCV